MAEGLTPEQFKELKKLYRERRDLFPGPRLTTAEFHLVVAEIEKIEAGPGDPLQKFKAAFQARRDWRPNPLAGPKNRQ